MGNEMDKDYVGTDMVNTMNDSDLDFNDDADTSIQNNLTLAEEFEQMPNTYNGKKKKKRKKPWSKNKKIAVFTPLSIVVVAIVAVLAYVAILFFQAGPTQSLDGAPLKVDMADRYYVGTKGEIDLEMMFPGATGFSKTGSSASISGTKMKVSGTDGFTLSFTDADNKKVTKNVIVIANGENVATWEDFKDRADDGKDIVLQSAKIAVPKLQGLRTKDIQKDYVINLTSSVYGNGCVVNVFELVCSRNKPKAGKWTEPFLEGNGKVGGEDAINIMPTEEQIVFQDVHITGNDLNFEEGGNMYGLPKEDYEDRGLLVFSKYGSCLDVRGEEGNGTNKANVLVKHCVIENSHKVFHVRNANLDIEGTIIRNASDTALSVATEPNEASYIKSKNNVIANSLTGGILFYCYSQISDEQAKNGKTWNTLEIVEDTFLDIFNWKEQNGIVLLPETEGAYAGIANTIAGGEIPKAEYDKLKAENEGSKYVHFAIIKIRTGGGWAKNDSKVVGYKEIGYSTCVENGFENGFPIPGVATAIMKDIDVWGYYGNNNGSVKAGDVLNEERLETLYVELREGRKEASK